MPDVDLGAGDRLAVGIEHAAADREGADAIERVAFGLRRGSAVRRATEAGAGLPFRGSIAAGDQGGRGRPCHQPGAHEGGRGDRQLLEEHGLEHLLSE